MTGREDKKSNDLFFTCSLIAYIAREEEIEVIDALIAAYHSKTSDLIEDYNGSFYYENPQTIFDTYQHGGNPA